MSVVSIQVRGMTEGTLDNDIVVVKDSGGREVRFAFNISPKGTADADVVTTEVDQKMLADVAAAIVSKKGTVIRNNPAWEDVKTDDDGDGISDTDRYNWAQQGQLYELVMGS